jgi:hypothetical protein
MNINLVCHTYEVLLSENISQASDKSDYNVLNEKNKKYNSNLSIFSDFHFGGS